MGFMFFWQSIGYASLAKVNPQYGLCKLLIYPDVSRHCHCHSFVCRKSLINIFA